ncbi:MAG TPA: xanthine dehydrogenase family protein molybdopterin-binding subunit [Desulfobacteraceae bacterium]|nr:xanthine dehydrogenase family protein molybdopterin-binding subunit [Desulfobacteraceae bacterium]HPJ68014.1 xanthine dehydrogenase family protein molybdopterin-binding subunit [Desulfobacteraceae bacterium]
MKEDLKSIGKNFERYGSLERLKGKPVFCADLELESPLTLKVLRSTRAHARIARIDTEKAAGIKGLVKIFTAKDIPGKNITGIINKDRPLLVPDKVRCVGDAIALVAAESEESAESALNAINVIYEDLPVVSDAEEALKEGAPKIHEKGNLLFSRKIKRGDVDKAFERCSAVVEKIYRTSFVEHTYLEPDAGAGYVEEDGTLVIFASTQNPHYDHSEVISLLGVEDDRVRIIQAATGGGFGSKLDLNVQGFIGLALFHLKKPVRYVYTREESFLATAKRHPLTISMKTGADQSGKILAMKARILCDTGAYGSYGIAVASRSAVHATGPYAVENVDVEAPCIYTNKPFAGAMRGFGAPQMAFAHESQMDLLAEKLHMDPLEIRRLNALQVGSTTCTGQELKASIGIGECLEAVRSEYAEALKVWRSEPIPPFKKRGIGIGAMWYGIGNTGMQNPSTAQIEIDLEGAITLYTGCADIGQGSTTILSQIAGETLGLPPADIKIIVADTKFTTNAGATSASRQTYISGNAVKDAADKLADFLLTEGVDILKVPKKNLVLDSGLIRHASDSEKNVTLAKVVKRAHRKGLPLKWHGYFDPVTEPLDPETGQGMPYATYAFACHLAQVTVDIYTGEVEVNRVVAAHDVGKAIYPEGVIGQICGGVAMGIGFALMEEYVPGETESMKDYFIPTFSDMPEVIPIIIESSEPTGPFGAKGVGEPALIPTAPAVVNAISNAVGERVYSLPANLERVLEASIKSGQFSPKEVNNV